ncbi:MAG TPA: peptidase T [Gemmatimonadaceae bacterium]|jgi:tripeptide aminopeptidase
MLIPPGEGVVDRFLRYVRIDTQSKEGESATPSTEKQWALSRMLVEELRELGARDVRVSEYCMVYATLPSNLPNDSTAKVPVIGFLAHVDTSPALTGANVKPVIHRNYQGGDIALPGDANALISVARNPLLGTLIGDDIITTDGTTLLGSDDKAGVAAIMALVDLLAKNPQVPHATIKIGFTADEEIGVGIDKFDVGAFGAKFAYTVDGGELGEISDETWSARLATITFQGRNTHPGTAKGVMVNSIQALAHYVTLLPNDMLPETTSDRVGFVHPYAGTVDVEESRLQVLLRDFDLGGLEAKESLLRQLAVETEAHVPGMRVHVDVKEQYKNMKEVLKRYPELTENAMEAARRAGVEAFLRPVRGGTDGSKLTFRGLPCPNIFTGGHNFHGRLEFNSRRGLEKTTETLLELVKIFVERAQ